MPRLVTTAWISVAIALLLADGANLPVPSGTNEGTLAARMKVLGAATVHVAKVNQNERDSHVGTARLRQGILASKRGEI
jgi:hypothetical protein